MRLTPVHRESHQLIPPTRLAPGLRAFAGGGRAQEVGSMMTLRPVRRDAWLNAEAASSSG